MEKNLPQNYYKVLKTPHRRSLSESEKLHMENSPNLIGGKKPSPDRTTHIREKAF